jgi:hypothetical protein
MIEEGGAYRKGKSNSRGNSRTPNSPRKQQTQQCTLLAIESLSACTDDAEMPRAKIVHRSPVQILLDAGLT